MDNYDPSNHNEDVNIIPKSQENNGNNTSVGNFVAVADILDVRVDKSQSNVSSSNVIHSQNGNTNMIMERQTEQSEPSNNEYLNSSNYINQNVSGVNNDFLVSVKQDDPYNGAVIVKEEVSYSNDMAFESQSGINSSVVLSSGMAIKNDPNMVTYSDIPTHLHLTDSKGNTISNQMVSQNSHHLTQLTTTDSMVVDGSRLALTSSRVHIPDDGGGLDPSVLPGVVEGLQELATSGNGHANVAEELLKQTQFTSNVSVQQSPIQSNSYEMHPANSHFTLNNGKASQNQVFLQQGNQLVAVSIPSSHSDHQVAILPSGAHIIQNQAPSYAQSTLPKKILVQTNKRAPISSSNQSPGHYVIQVGNNATGGAQRIVEGVNKNHIVIRSNSTILNPNEIKTEPGLNIPSSSKGVFKVIIPEGTTKQRHPYTGPQANDETIRKHVQINLSNRGAKQSYAEQPQPQPQQMAHWDTGVQTLAHQSDDDEYESGVGRGSKKLYECTNCNSKFMKPFYLRMHRRSCKKAEVKREKTPLFMCSFCKATFTTKDRVNHHFTQCFQNPYKVKEGVKRKEEEQGGSSTKKGRHVGIDESLEQAVQFKCQDCDRTFNKERQYTSHIKRCTKTSVHDLTGAKQEVDEEVREEETELIDDPFADPPSQPPISRRGRSSGRRGRPPGRAAAHQVRQPKTASNSLFEGEPVAASSSGLLVADNDGIVRSTTGLAHTVQLSLETASIEGAPRPAALVADSKGVRGREKPPQAWSLVCALCQKMFFTKPALANHMMTEHGPDLIHTRDIRMARTKDNSKLYRCPMCELHYSSGEPLLEHLVLQHTSKLQESYTALQTQTATFVCSLCSLVLLTRNLLMEHLSINHLEELEALAQCDSHVTMETTNKMVPQVKNENGVGPSFIKTESEKILECGFCGEEINSHDAMVKHYTEVHGVETDEDGCLLDLGIDVDIRVKDTKSLLRLADGRVDESVPDKTVLIRKKPRQTWQCKDCQQVFTRHFELLRHVRDVCPNGDQEAKANASKESHFRCQEPNCSHLTFYQVKSLFKHMEEEHNVLTPRQRKAFKSLAQFYQWLYQEEEKLKVRYIRDSCKMEKNNMKLIQLVCHRFHSAKADQSRENREAMEGKTDKNKKRWSVRIQRSSDCHARIHLRVQHNPISNDFDGETQMVYYPQHTHNEEEPPPDVTDKILDRQNREKVVYFQSNPNNGSCKKVATSIGELPKEVTGETSTGQPVIIRNSESGTLISRAGTLMAQYMDEFCQTQLEGEMEGSPVFVTVSGSENRAVGQGSALVIQRSVSDTASLTSRTATVSSGQTVMVDHGNGKTVLMDGGRNNTFIQEGGMVMDMDIATGGNIMEESANVMEEGEEYVLPADEAEWTKLFEVLKNRLESGELNGQEQVEAEALKSCQEMLSLMSLPDQVGIFQKLCALTNTAFESAE